MPSDGLIISTEVNVIVTLIIIATRSTLTPGFKGVLSLEETDSIFLVYEFTGFQQYKLF